MSKIIQLEQHVADLIAAGEVVSRPASVVKELLENSIDAGAGIITVEISSGGMTYIRITDDGCGIAPDDVKTAFLRHATSKLQNAAGLEAIETLGFRGEALAAIAAVSRIEIITRTSGVGEGVSPNANEGVSPNAGEGVRANTGEGVRANTNEGVSPNAGEGVRGVLEAGTPLSFSPTGCPVGTTIIVRDLFFNTPARLKFMKTDRAEGSAVSSVVMRCALSRPDISFRYIKDGKPQFHTPGDSQVDSCVYNLLGREIALGFIPVDLSDESVSVRGFTSSPSDARGNRGYQFFFINGRVVRSLLLQSALEQAYKNKILSGRFPSCALYITTGANNVDVNVHPAKTEVRFVSDKQVFDGVYYAVLGALERGGEGFHGGSGGGSSRGNSHSDNGTRGNISHSDSSVFRNDNNTLSNTRRSDNLATGNRFENLSVDDYLRKYSNRSSDTYSNRPSTSAYSGQPKPAPPPAYAADTKYAPAYTEQSPADIEHIEQPPSTSAQDKTSPNETARKMPSVGYFRVIGEALDTYIICEFEESVWFIDKHAAHERICFNALLSGEYEPMSEALISPVVCRMGYNETSLLLENAPLLETLGFSVEGFGEDSVAARYIPSYIHQKDVESVLTEICTALERGETSEQSKSPSTATLEKIYKTLACGAAIKAGSSSDKKELEALAERVLSGEISHCPHGRPVSFALTKTAIEKRFDRI